MKYLTNYLVLFLFLISSALKAQLGLAVSPPRSYFNSAPNESSVQKIIISNSSKTHPLTLTISVKDWQYNEKGDNVVAEPGSLPNSVANWLTIKPQSYLTLQAGESKEIEVIITPPAQRTDTLNIHTGLLFITQTNPISTVNEKGALVNVTLRSGVKIYHRYNVPVLNNIDFTNFTYAKEKKSLILDIENKGNVWTDGPIVTELINQNDGTKHQLEQQIIYTLPGDQRSVPIPLPIDLKPGKYIATSTFSYGDDDTIKMAELTFNHE